MKIGIMTMQRIKNYGSYLQAYGLKRLCEDLGCEVVFVDYKVEDPVKIRGTYKGTKIYKLLRVVWRKIKRLRGKLHDETTTKVTKFSQFIKDFETVYIPGLGVPEKKQYRTKVDVLVIGSDEVFNCTQGEGVGFSRELFGANNCAGKLISYAASFGNTTREKLKSYGIEQEVSSLLKKFSTISVRDRNSAEIVCSLTGKKPMIHLDPVLMYDFKNDVKDIVDIKDYIIVYAYNKRITEEEGETIRQFARTQNKKLIALSGQQAFCDEYVYCEPLEILSYFKHADYVITDTFHGTIFSIINHRKFATLVRKDENAKGYGNQEKLEYLLEVLGLESRKIENLQQLEQVLKATIDYKKVDEIIEKERIRTKNYLREQLGE